MTIHQNGYTIAEENMLIAAFHSGMNPEAIAEALQRTPGAVRWKLNHLGLLKAGPKPLGPWTLDGDPCEGIGLRNMRSDLAFKRRMLKAIHDGTESPFIGIIRSCSWRYIPHVNPTVNCNYRSSAAMAAEG